MGNRLPPKESWIRKRPKTAGGEDEYVSVMLSHPAMQNMRTAIEYIGRAARDYRWIKEHDPKGRLKYAIEILVELTSVTRGR